MGVSAERSSRLTEMAWLQLTLITILAVSAVVIHTQETPEATDPQPDTDDLEVEPTQTFYTGSGPLQGRKVTTATGSSHYEFLGIPFAEPPIGRLRFRAPQSVQPWQETLEASKDGSTCLQPQTGFEFGDLSNMSEDCLTLNIFTTSTRHHNKPVMFWIHGGGFTSGSKDLYRMRGLIEEGVVLVSTNYRLHALGFLSFGNTVVSGNMGLQDQHLALQWVRHNIRQFGGDPERITIFGESAGAMSVQAQVLSPCNIGLLGGAIAQSGSMLFLSVTEAGFEVEVAEAALEALGCPTARDWTSLNCLQAVDMEKMISNITDDPQAFMDPNIDSKFAFWPVIDSYASNPFLPLDPLEALKTGQFNSDVPYMSGIVKNEGVLMTGGLRLAGFTGSQVLPVVTQMADSGPLAMIGDDENLMRIATRFYNHPTGDTDIEQEQPASDLLTDTWFGSFDQKSVELMSGHTRNVYNYYLTQQTNNSLIAPMFNLPAEYTPIHGDDLAFLISSNNLEDTLNLSEEERETARLMIKYWTNFAKYGNPSPIGTFDVPTWYPVTPDRMRYMELKAEPEVGENLLADRMQFWEAMVWQEKESRIELQTLYNKITGLLSDNNVVY